MSLFFLIRTDLKNDGIDSKIKESELKKTLEKNLPPGITGAAASFITS